MDCPTPRESQKLKKNTSNAKTTTSGERKTTSTISHLWNNDIATTSIVRNMNQNTQSKQTDHCLLELLAYIGKNQE